MLDIETITAGSRPGDPYKYIDIANMHIIISQILDDYTFEHPENDRQEIESALIDAWITGLAYGMDSTRIEYTAGRIADIYEQTHPCYDNSELSDALMDAWILGLNLGDRTKRRINEIFKPAAASKS